MTRWCRSRCCITGAGLPGGSLPFSATATRRHHRPGGNLLLRRMRAQVLRIGFGLRTLRDEVYLDLVADLRYVFSEPEFRALERIGRVEADGGHAAPRVGAYLHQSDIQCHG